MKFFGILQSTLWPSEVCWYFVAERGDSAAKDRRHNEVLLLILMRTRILKARLCWEEQGHKDKMKK